MEERGNEHTPAFSISSSCSAVKSKSPTLDQIGNPSMSIYKLGYSLTEIAYLVPVVVGNGTLDGIGFNLI